MSEKIKCEYCNEEILNKNKKRHHNSLQCKEKQINNTNTIEYNCKYCKKAFNQNNNKNKHEIICTAKELYYELEQTKKELEYKDKLIEVKTNEADRADNAYMSLKRENDLLLNQLALSNDREKTQPKIYNNCNIIQVNVINYDKIKDHEQNYTIDMLISGDEMIKYLLNIFSGSILKLDDTKKIIGYFEQIESGKEMIKDKDCRQFLVNCAKKLEGYNNKLYESNNKILSVNDDRQASINKKFSSEIANEKGKYKKNRLYREMVNGIMNKLE